MAKIRHGVFQIDRHWLVCSEHRHLGRFVDRQAAISAPKRAACRTMGDGFEVELHIMEPAHKSTSPPIASNSRSAALRALAMMSGVKPSPIRHPTSR